MPQQGQVAATRHDRVTDLHDRLAALLARLEPPAQTQPSRACLRVLEGGSQSSAPTGSLHPTP